MTDLQKLDARREKLESELEKLYEEYARWEKQLCYDYRDRHGDMSGTSLLRNLPVDECMGAMRQWLDIAQAKQRLVDLDADYAVWLWKSQPKKLNILSRFLCNPTSIHGRMVGPNGKRRRAGDEHHSCGPHRRVEP